VPPGPIASPGIKSIRAALYPADVDYLFFVGKNNGMHYFSSTGEEHVKAVTYYQVNNGTGEFEKEKKDKTNIVGWN
nr:endolytic transglycosylase MltG [bacterium]